MQTRRPEGRRYKGVQVLARPAAWPTEREERWGGPKDFLIAPIRISFRAETILDLTVGIPPRYPSAWMSHPKAIRRCRKAIFHLKEIHD
jgi:hypothetical protein